jgi:hypothetical protein
MFSLFKIFFEKREGLIDHLGLWSYLILVLCNILYILTIIGFALIDQTYLERFVIIVHILICLFLIYRFNPFGNEIKIRQYDKAIIFDSSIFLLLNILILNRGFMDTATKYFYK